MREESIVPGENMADGAYECWVAAFKHKIDQKEISQRDLAERVGKTAEHLNAVYKERTGKNGKPTKASDVLQEKIAEVFGYTMVEFLKLGQRVLERLPPDMSKKIAGEIKDPRPQSFFPSIPIGPTDYTDPDQVVSAVMALTRQYRKADGRLRFWRSIYENLPSSVVVIRDGIVAHQNIKAREWGQVPGSAPCEHCVGRGICDPGDCAIKDSMATGVAATKYKLMGGEVYKISVLPIHLKDADYYIAVATHIDMATALAVQKKAAIDKQRRRKEDIPQIKGESS